MRPPEFTGGNVLGWWFHPSANSLASMRPPEFTGGNVVRPDDCHRPLKASMRPPEFTGGNPMGTGAPDRLGAGGFNEAAGIHRRKPSSCGCQLFHASLGFNEAAGIHRRKHPSRPDRGGGGSVASMRPPEFTGGNWRTGRSRRVAGLLLQ